MFKPRQPRSQDWARMGEKYRTYQVKIIDILWGSRCQSFMGARSLSLLQSTKHISSLGSPHSEDVKAEGWSRSCLESPIIWLVNSSESACQARDHDERQHKVTKALRLFQSFQALSLFSLWISLWRSQGCCTILGLSVEHGQAQKCSVWLRFSAWFILLSFSSSHIMSPTKIKPDWARSQTERMLQRRMWPRLHPHSLDLVHACDLLCCSGKTWF